MSDFNLAIDKVLTHEGGFVNHSNDPGGATNFGISLRFLKAEGKLHDYDFDDDGDIDADDIRLLTPEKAREIYKMHWWDKFGYAHINNQTLATKLLDMAINMGQSQAVRLFQKAINILHTKIIVKEDGILGNLTIEAINNENSEALLNQVRKECTYHYEMIVVKNPKLVCFLNGWSKRARS